jgi:hypothetical protein
LLKYLGTIFNLYWLQDGYWSTEKAILKSKDLNWMDKVGAMNIEMHLDGKNIDNF